MNEETLKRIRAEDKQCLMDPSRWTIPGICPVKRYVGQGKMPESGTVMSYAKTTVIRAGIYQLADMTREEQAKVERTEYADIDAMLADGWTVD